MKPKVVAFRSDACGVSWYRMRTPIREMCMQDLIEIRTTPDMMPMQLLARDKSEQQQRIQAMAQQFYMGLADGADVLHTQRWCNQEMFGLFTALSMLNGVPWVIDVDDDVVNLDTSNPAYDTYKHRTDDDCYDQRPIKNPNEARDNEIVIKRQDDGKLFAVSMKAQDTRELTLQQIQAADALFVSTQDLANLYRGIRRHLHPQDHIYVLPNSLDPDVWDSIEKPADHGPEVWVGWAGSTSHARDIHILIDVARYVLEAYRNTCFFWNRLPHPAFLQLAKEYPQRCMMYDAWSSVENWADYYVSMNFDIALGPLIDTAFNRGKSNLKWLEAGICGQPFIGSNVVPYHCIRHGTDGFKASRASQWKRALDELIQSKSRRQDVGGAARERVLREFNLKRNARLWVEAYQDVSAKLGPMARERTARIRTDAVPTTD